MTTVRISSDWGHQHVMEWCGAPPLDAANGIERSLEIPEVAYEKIEAGITQGNIEGIVFLDDGTKFQWFLDGKAAPHPRAPFRPQAKDANSPSDARPKTESKRTRSRRKASEVLDLAAVTDQPDKPSGGFVLGHFLGTHTICPHCGQPLAGHMECRP